MSYENLISVRQGEKVPLYGTASVSGGTVQVQASPAPTFTLFTSAGSVVTGFSPAVSVTGYDTAAAALVRVWYTLDTSAMTAGSYIGQLIFSVLGSDGILRNERATLFITLFAGVEIAATYDATLLLTTPLYQARLQGRDTDASNPMFSDAEWLYFLFANSSLPNLAAANALEIASYDASKLAILQKQGGVTTDMTKLPGELRLSAKMLRETAPVLPAVVYPDPVFTLDNARTGLTGANDLW